MIDKQNVLDEISSKGLKRGRGVDTELETVIEPLVVGIHSGSDLSEGYPKLGSE